MSDKITQIVEYQDKQRTPAEALEYLKAEDIEQMMIIYKTKDDLAYLFASGDRQYRLAEALWDIEQVKSIMLFGDD